MRRDEDGNPPTNQERWESDIGAKYVGQEGELKNMSFRMRDTAS